jgi:hypothetical protein
LRVRIFIPLWKRPEVTRFCFEGVKRLQKESKHTIDVSCVISEPEYIEMCSEFGFNWTYEKNDPLGEKMNLGIASTLKYEYDYLMVMNSDNEIETELIDKFYDPFFEKLTPYFGIDRVTYVNWGTTEARDFKYEFTILGIGKCIHRSVVERLRGKLYRPTLNKCLDHTMMDIMIQNRVFPVIVKYEGQLAKDFKSEVNIWPWERFKNRGTKVCYKQRLDAVN